MGPEALGPSDITFTGNQKFVLSIGLGGSDTFRAGFGADGALLATLVTGKLKQGGWSLFADVLANEATANPDGTDIDSNPVGIARDGEGYLVADAGGNAIVRASHKGTFTTITTLPPGSALAPPFVPPGTQMPTDAVPTSVVQGPDGAYYLTQLTGFPFEKGDANIWRVAPGQAPTVYASGLTNLTDLAFADDGSLYAVQISVEGLLTGPIGALVKINPGSDQHETIAGGLFSRPTESHFGAAPPTSASARCALAGARSSRSPSTIRPTEPFAPAGSHAPVGSRASFQYRTHDDNQPSGTRPARAAPRQPGRCRSAFTQQWGSRWKRRG